MAAHSVNILIELVSELPFIRRDEDREASCDLYLTALAYAPGMDELAPLDWRRLKVVLEEYREDDCLAGISRVSAIHILGRQITKWGCLGGPESHEDWMKAKYPKEEE